MEELKEKAARLRVRQTERAREGYRYARSLGFSPAEASVLMGHSKKTIECLASERRVSDVKTS